MAHSNPSIAFSSSLVHLLLLFAHISCHFDRFLPLPLSKCRAGQALSLRQNGAKDCSRPAHTPMKRTQRWAEVKCNGKEGQGWSCRCEDPQHHSAWLPEDGFLSPVETPRRVSAEAKRRREQKNKETKKTRARRICSKRQVLNKGT